MRTGLTRDWRIRTLVPVVILNLGAFAALYGLMYHFAISNLVKTEKAAGAVLLDELELTFPDMMRDRTGQTLQARMAREAALHNLADMNVFDAESRPVLMTFGTPPPGISHAVRSTLGSGTGGTQWIVAPGNRTMLVGIRPLVNRSECQRCHIPSTTNLGAIQMSIDLTNPINDAAGRVRSRFAMAGLAWIALLVPMFWAGGVVIGRPLKKIQRSLTAAEPAPSEGQDLEALAKRVDQTIWTLIERQRKREDDIARHMARAEQLAALGEIAAGLTHEIRNPLAGVISALELVRDDIGDGHREIVDQMIGELRRVSTTLDSLLRLARPQPPQRTTIDLARTVRDLTSIFTARFRRMGVALEVDCSDAAPSLPLDAGLMAQLVVNLLTNSLQATDRNGTVRVIVAPFPRRDGIVLAVSDTGRGISPENLDHIFDPFFTTKEEGTGLGLAICRQIVEQHGGTITVESELDKGTRVVVLLPAARAGVEGRNGLAAVS
jgi:signal transduction histidine kinase